MPKGVYDRYQMPKAAKKMGYALAFESVFGRAPKKGEHVKRRLKNYEREKREEKT